MEITALELIAIALSTWAISCGIVSGTADGEIVNQDEILKWLPSEDVDVNTPPVPRYANGYFGETDGYKGPFGIYGMIRKLLSRGGPVSRDAGACRICISFTVAIFFTALALLSHPLADLILYGMAAHGAIIVYSNIAYLIFDVPVNDI